jgi:hypothetical protein
MKKVTLPLTILLSFIYFSSCTVPCKEPERPLGIPKEAIWNGGCDGGYWLHLISIEENKYRFKIFVDYDSTVLMDADFVPSEKCLGLDMPKDRSILNMVSVVEPENILIKLDESKFCSLNPVYPAYGGYDWEIIKKKGTY